MKTEGIYTAGDPAQLERPTWSALTTRHASFALGNGLARRYPLDISPMSAVREVSERKFYKTWPRFWRRVISSDFSAPSRLLRPET